MRKTKRLYKDSLFRDIFSNEERLSEIYEALLGRKADPQDITLATMDETLFDGIKNDVGFIVRDEYVILIEHQSTINENMPLRLFMYLAEIYRRHVDEDSVYRKKRIRLPAPRFYVFYNGMEEVPDTWRLRLSDAFDGRQGSMELVVDVININIDDKKERLLLGKSHALKSYSVFVAKVRECIKNGSTLEAAVGEAVQYCVSHDYLREYFRQKHKKEVFDMLNFAWNQERALKVCAEEAREDGLAQGLENGLAASIANVMKNMGVSMEKAMDVLQIPAAERAKYAQLVKG